MCTYLFIQVELSLYLYYCCFMCLYLLTNQLHLSQVPIFCTTISYIVQFDQSLNKLVTSGITLINHFVFTVIIERGWTRNYSGYK